VSADDPRPPYQQVADDLRAAITSGALRTGEKLPSGRELAHRYAVALMTIQKALGLLRDEGHVVSYQGRGVFVRDAGNAGPSPTTASAEFTEFMHRIDELRAAMDQAIDQIGQRLDRLEYAAHHGPELTSEPPARAPRRSR
jgi:DNA-binding GntR family transcriptional regulator